ncbi:MAG: OmpA family protein [Thermodesulfobacteriota bacterium]
MRWKAWAVQAFILGLFLTVLASVPPWSAPAYEFHPQGWDIPQLYGAEKYADEMIDFDKSVPGAETRLEKFYTGDGGRVFRYSHLGNVFSLVVGRSRTGPLDYELVDADGSGAFEIRQSPADEYPLPVWTFKPRMSPGVFGGKGLGESGPAAAGWSLGREEILAALSAAGPGAKTITGSPALGKIVLRINFEFNSDVLTSEARSTLNEVGAAMTSPQLTGSRFLIEGHTDSVGSTEYNQDLSERRARAVLRHLHTHFGLASDRLEARGKGKSEPLDKNNPADGVNRRVEITNLGSRKS